ncbi:T9SS type A sorting domain-containing protein [Hymenobacter sp. BT523]|uniref:T9SS type A sorting domain-containing protein n=1 Tax=Hymenobacter sp. BT523 TaxID=2795725 RepID=UPI0018EAADD0|nr:T9SS type A sorting domain-containing protein [Hymenobacter sp. BT523]MBJ6107946.1 T9SS type A sorting domain-containing protein [Hymenobacter sp. BT523]
MKHFFSLWRGWPAALLVLLWLAGPAARAQAPAWQMAVAAGGPNSYVQTMAADGSGNVYVAGSFSGTATFGSTTLTSAGGKDVFVAKWNNTTRGFVWAQSAGGTADDAASKVAVNGTSIFLAGSSSSPTVNFGATQLTNSGNANGFIAKLIDAGNSTIFAWAQRTDGIVTSIAVNGSAIYTTGTFSSFARFDSVTLFGAGGSDVFVAKLTDFGTTSGFAWAKQAGGAGSDYATAIAVSGTDVYVAGFFLGSSTVFGNLTVANAGGQDAFVAKLTDAASAGNFVWAQRAGGTGNDQVTAISISGTGVYVAGRFGFPSASFGSASLTTAGGTDIFIAKLTDSGPGSSFVWAQRAGSPYDDYAMSLSMASGNSMYLTGIIDSPTADFGGTVLTTAGDTDMYVAKLQDNGNNAAFAWAQQAGGIFNDQGSAVAASGTQVYVAGNFGPPAAFGSYTITGSGIISGFLASLTDPTLTATTGAQGTLRFALAPNPASATAAVQLPALPGAASATLTLLDAMGRTVRSWQAVPGTRVELGLTGLASGLYAVRACAGSTVGTQRLVVE